MRPHRLFAVPIVLALLLPSAGAAKQRDKGPFEYLSPLPDTEWISPETNLIFRPGVSLRNERWMSSLEVEGSVSGRGTGRWITVSDGKTFIFEPSRNFVPGERVRVELRGAPGGSFGYSFTIAPRTVVLPRSNIPSCLQEALPAKRDWRGRPVTSPRQTKAGYELPDLFPDIDILVNHGPAPGSLFISSMVFGPGNEGRYLIMLGHDGEPEFFRAVSSRTLWDFKVQPDGRLSFFHSGVAKYFFMDDTYTIVDSVWTHNYPSTDAHGVQVMPNGNFLVMGQQEIPYDMSDVVEGGNPDAHIVNMIVQEIDTDYNVVFEWRSFDHFDPLDAIGYDLTGERVDYVHSNSVALDHDGGLIVSHRHLDAITKISRDTGDIVWIMGGKHNDFTLVGDTQWFTHQHSARRQAGGTLTVFDNGNNSDPQESRVVEYMVDEDDLVATLVWEYRHDPAQYGRAMGNAHRLPNGNTVVGWGIAQPNVTEVRPDGTVAYEVLLPDDMYSYRAFRFDWNGVAARPDLWANTHDNTLSLNFTKFGDQDVSVYNVYRGDGPQPTQLMRTTDRQRVVVHGFDAGQTLYFRVTAVDGNGGESPYSNEVAVTPEFSDRLTDAKLTVSPSTINLASGGKWIDANVDFVAVEVSEYGPVEDLLLNGAVAPERVTVTVAGGLHLKFARADVAAVLEIGESVEVTVSGRAGDSEFAASDYVRVIAPGREDVDSGDGDGEDEGRSQASKTTALLSVLPNPFNPTTVIRYRVAAPGELVTIEVFDVTGRRIRTLVEGRRPAGDASVTWDGRDHAGQALASGVYFCRLRSGGVTQTRKLLLMK